jgi:hypothetical protein
MPGAGGEEGGGAGRTQKGELPELAHQAQAPQRAAVAKAGHHRQVIKRVLDLLACASACVAAGLDLASEKKIKRMLHMDRPRE